MVLKPLRGKSFVAYGAAVALFVLIGGCGQAIVRTPVPAELADKAQIPGMSRVHFWVDRVDPDMQAEWMRMGKEHPVLDKDKSAHTLNIQPVIPFSISDDWNLITRTIIPLKYNESFADLNTDSSGGHS